MTCHVIDHMIQDMLLNYTRQVVQIENYESMGLNRKSMDLHMHMHMYRQPLSASLSYRPFLPAILARGAKDAVCFEAAQVIATIVKVRMSGGWIK
jgi:hypothetical protein